MGDTVKTADKLKASFGFVSDGALKARKKEVGKVLDELDDKLGKLPDTTPAKALQFQKDTAGRLRDRMKDYAIGTLEAKPAYKECDTVEKLAKRAIKAVDALEESEKQLPALKQMVSDGDLKGLDKLVAKKGDKVKSAEDQGFLIAAIRARYDIDEMSGELTSSALPRFYKVLGSVPDTHARLNPQLKKIVRGKESGTSDFGSRTITINAGEASPFTSDKEEYNNSEGKKLKLNNFDAHTLHETGHSVDEACQYMNGHMAQDDHGAWENLTVDQVAAVVVDKKLKASFPTLDAKKLKWLAMSMLTSTVDQAVLNEKTNEDKLNAMSKEDLLTNGAVVATDAKVKEFLETLPGAPNDTDRKNCAAAINAGQMLAQNTEKDPFKETLIAAVVKEMREKALRADAAIDNLKSELQAIQERVPSDTEMKAIKKDADGHQAWAKLIRGELWWKSSSEIEGAAIGDFVYQADGTKWWKYKKAARGKMVRNYQFRSPAEWFAEVYTVYMSKKLPPSHPAYANMGTLDPSKPPNG